MKWSRSKNMHPDRWRKWFAIIPTIVHENELETIWVWLECYRWKRRASGAIERREFWDNADPYIVPNSVWRP